MQLKTKHVVLFSSGVNITFFPYKHSTETQRSLKSRFKVTDSTSSTWQVSFLLPFINVNAKLTPSRFSNEKVVQKSINPDVDRTKHRKKAEQTSNEGLSLLSQRFISSKELN